MKKTTLLGIICIAVIAIIILLKFNPQANFTNSKEGSSCCASKISCSTTSKTNKETRSCCSTKKEKSQTETHSHESH